MFFFCFIWFYIGVIRSDLLRDVLIFGDVGLFCGCMFFFSIFEEIFLICIYIWFWLLYRLIFSFCILFLCGWDVIDIYILFVYGLYILSFCSVKGRESCLLFEFSFSLIDVCNVEFVIFGWRMNLFSVWDISGGSESFVKVWLWLI